MLVLQKGSNRSFEEILAMLCSHATFFKSARLSPCLDYASESWILSISTMLKLAPLEEVL